MNCFTFENVDDFDLNHIFECGQCFRWVPADDGTGDYTGAAGPYAARISYDAPGRRLRIEATGGDESFWSRYFDLETDYAEIKKELAENEPGLTEALQYGSGIRILNQDLFETIISFIVSQNNNIPRIKHLTEALCESAGSPFDPGGMRSHGAPEVCYSFPDPEAVSRLGIDKLREMKTGFRAGYIQGAAQDISSGRLMLGAVASAPSTADAASMLVRLRGVGPKVAACTLLFGFGRLDAFPVDVWVKRVIAKYFGDGFRAEELGSYAGIAQQYLFRHERGF